MAETNQQTQLSDQLADLQETMQREKVELTPEVEAYLKESVEKVQGKLINGEPVYPKDMEFIEWFKIWIDFGGEYSIKDTIDRTPQKEQLKLLAQQAGKDDKWIDENFEIEGSFIVFKGFELDLSGCKEITKLPERLKVEGGMDLSDCTGLRQLPKVLIVEHTLDMQGCTGLTSLTGKLVVKGALGFRKCINLTQLSDDLEIGSHLNLNRCKNFSNFPKGVKKINGNLVAQHCPALKQLPDGLEITGDLYLLNSGIKNLPKGLKVRGHLAGCNNLRSFPDDIEVNILNLHRVASGHLKDEAERLLKAGKIKKIEWGD